MPQLKFFKIATIALLIANLILLGIVFMGNHRPPPPHEKPRGGADKLLNLDKDQNTRFLSFAEEHKKEIIDLNKNQKELLTQYFKMIPAQSENELDSLLNQIQNFERRKIQLTYQHIQDVKGFLKPEQEANFDAFLDHLLQAISDKRRKK